MTVRVKTMTRVALLVLSIITIFVCTGKDRTGKNNKTKKDNLFQDSSDESGFNDDNNSNRKDEDYTDDSGKEGGGENICYFEEEEFDTGDLKDEGGK